MKRFALTLLVLSGAVGLPAQTLPPEITRLLKAGAGLDRVWLNPKYDASSGFRLGRIESRAQGLLSGSLVHLPEALGRLVIPGSSNVLDVTVTDLYVRDAYVGRASAALAAEGRIVDKDGQVMFAFATRQEVDNRDSAYSDCLAAMDQVALGIARQLGGPMAQAYQAKASADDRRQSLFVFHDGAQVPAPALAGERLPPPAPASRPPGARERLLELQQLLDSELITREEFSRQRTRILEGL